jgi:hypothetical protein
MPGFVETTIQTGYGYLDPYVEKARATVPLIDFTAKQAEVYMPPLITRVDEFAEPRIEKIKPYVEPRIEQVKEVVTPRLEQVKEAATPYVEQGAKQYEILREEGVKYYTVAQHKVDQTTQYTGEKLGKVEEFKDAVVLKLCTLLSKKGHEINNIFRVPATKDVEGLQYKTMMGKVVAVLEKTELLVDIWLPEPAGISIETYDAAAVPNGTYDEDCTAYSYLLPRMLSLPMKIKTRLVYKAMAKGKVAVVSAQRMRTECTTSAKTQFFKIHSTASEEVESVKAKIQKMATPRLSALKGSATCKKNTTIAALTPKVIALKKSTQFKKAIEVVNKSLTFSVATCEKTLGKEKTDIVISKSEMLLAKVEGYMPNDLQQLFAAVPAASTKAD